MSIWKNGKLVAGGSQALPLLTFMWADHILDDISWLRADTFSWQSGSVYQAVYQHLANDIDGKALQSETIGGTTIQFYLADDGHKICPASEESNVVAIYNATGVAWYYIIDTVNERFKLPRTKYGITGLRDNVGNYVSESLPNIKFAFNQDGNHSNGSGLIWGVSGALTATSATGRARYNPAGTGTVNTGHIEFSASNSSLTYQDSAPVQQRATQMYLYFYVGQFTQTALENTAGITAETLNDKADADLSNVSQTGKNTAINWLMPDYSQGINVPLTGITQWEAPIDCFVSYQSGLRGTAIEQLYIGNVRVFLAEGNAAGMTRSTFGFYMKAGQTLTGLSPNDSNRDSTIYYFPLGA